MNKKVLVLNGSPRANGNTAVLIKQLKSGAGKSSADVEIITLHDLEIFPCDACDFCQ